MLEFTAKEHVQQIQFQLEQDYKTRPRDQTALLRPLAVHKKLYWNNINSRLTL